MIDPLALARPSEYAGEVRSYALSSFWGIRMVWVVSTVIDKFLWRHRHIQVIRFVIATDYDSSVIRIILIFALFFSFPTVVGCFYREAVVSLHDYRSILPDPHRHQRHQNRNRQMTLGQQALLALVQLKWAQDFVFWLGHLAVCGCLSGVLYISDDVS